MIVAPPRPGSRFGPYEIVRELGSGAFGIVFEAVRLPLRKRVALKLLHPSMVDTPEAVARFLREAETAAQLQHPHLVDVHDLGAVDGAPYLAMELLVGETLEDRLARTGPLPVEVAVDLLLPVLSAVAAMHAHGFVHRDIKPSNVLITQGPHGDHPKLLDLGIVKVQQHDGSITRTASLLGTPSFMSPEQVREARDIDARADVWSLAVTLYLCVTGAVPFTGGSMFETFDQVLHGPIVAPSRRVEGLPPGFDAVVLRAMRRECSARTATARELGRALMPFASEEGRAAWSREFLNVRSVPPVSAPTRRAPEPTLAEAPLRPSRVRAAAPVVGAVTALLVGAAGALLLVDRPSPAPPVTPVRIRPVAVTPVAPPIALPVDDRVESPATTPAPRDPPRRRHTPPPRAVRPASEIGNY